MRAEAVSWREAPNGDLLAALDGLKLVVRGLDGFARYLLLGPPVRGSGEVLLESGCAPDLATAKHRALDRAVTVAWLRRRKAAKTV